MPDCSPNCEGLRSAVGRQAMFSVRYAGLFSELDEIFEEVIKTLPCLVSAMPDCSPNMSNYSFIAAKLTTV